MNAFIEESGGVVEVGVQEVCETVVEEPETVDADVEGPEAKCSW